MGRPQLSLAIILLVAALGWIVLFWEPATETSSTALSTLQEVPKGGDFVLDSWQGPMDLKALRGKVVLLYFGYTHCPDVCPVGLSYISSALKQLNEEEVAQVQVLFISVDPERDSLEHLKDYGDYFHPAILGVSGSHDQLGAVAAMYGAAYHKGESKEPSGDYAVDHSTSTYLIDQQGVFRQTLGHGASAADILQAIRGLLRLT